MKTVRPVACYCTVAAVAFFTGVSRAPAAIIYDIPNTVYQQSFDSLPTSGQSLVWQNDSTLPGWTTSGGSSARITANNGTLALPGMQSYGNSADRALGIQIVAQTLPVTMAVSFINQSSQTLDSFTVTYDGEQWRKVANAVPQSLTFSYAFGSNFAGITSWTDVPSLTFTSPIANSLAAAPLDGNLAANRVADISATISGLEWVNGGTLWLRWTDTPDPGDDHGMGIDNLRFTSTTVIATPEPSSMLLLGVAGVGGMVLRGRKRFGAFFSRRDK